MTDEPLVFTDDQFTGRARVFPLPELVMFPHVVQALHVFEPRYRALLEEAVEGDRLMALATLSPGHETAPGRPPLEPLACLCRVATHQRTPEGTYNVLLLGVRRIRLGHELPPSRPFRVFDAEILAEEEPPLSSMAAKGLQARLLEAFKRALPRLPDAKGQLDQLLGSQITLGMLTDIVAYTLELDVGWKLRLLAETDALKRCALLLEAMQSRDRGGRSFPPPFSIN